MKYWTADLHLDHKNIIKYCHRPFRDVADQRATIIQNFKGIIRPGDELYILGDLAMNEDAALEFLRWVPGQKFIVWGNHDTKKGKYRSIISGMAVKTGDILETKVEDQLIVMSHYPLLRWNRAHFGSWMLHGHTHGELEYPFEGKILDVGVDAWGYHPVSFNQLKTKMDLLPNIQHHYFRPLDGEA